MRHLFPIDLLMLEAIREAEYSIAEDDKPHPRVGAILASQTGEILVRAHRGERGRGDHAEHILLQKAREQKIQLQDRILVVTLEPCTHRGANKTPCAIRVAASGIKDVWIGSLDPNPVMQGNGENRLRFAGLRVERFPNYLVEAIHRQSSDFIGCFSGALDRRMLS